MLNYAIKVIIATVVVFLLLNPEVVGVWNAKKDIAYDTFLGEHYNDN